MQPPLSFPFSVGAFVVTLASGVESRVLAQAVVPLSPVVVTAHHSDQPLVITADPRSPAQPMPVQDGAELLRSIPGFTVVRKGGADGDPVLRGMAGSRLGILIDGSVVLGGCGNRMDPPTAYVHPAAFDRVTVLKGPQSVIDGPGYSAGVVRFERDPRWLARRGHEASAGVTVGSFGRNDEAVRLRAVVRPVYLEATANRSASGDYRDGNGVSVHGGYERWNTQAEVAWTPDAQTVIEFAAGRGDGEARYADRAMDGVKFARDNAALGLVRDFTGGAIQRFEARAYVNQVDHVMDNFTLRPFAASGSMSKPAVSNPDRRTVGGRMQTRATLAGARLDVGADFQSNRHRLRSSSDATGIDYTSRPRVADAEFRQAGGFVELARELGEHNRWIAGGRIDDWRAEDQRMSIATGMSGTQPNPTANQRRERVLGAGFVRYEREIGRATAYGGIGYASRFPDYWEAFSKESADSLSAFGTRPERTRQLDTGVIWRGPRAAVSVSAFANRIDDFILIQNGVRKGMRTVTISRNIAAQSWGGEATGSWRFQEGWRADASVAHVRGDNRTDDRPLAQQPPLEGRLALAYANARWSAGAVGRWVAAQHRIALNQGNIAGQDVGPSSAFAVASVNAGWTLHRRARIAVGIDNLFDRAYAEHLSRSGSAVPGYIQVARLMEPGRTWWLKLDVQY